MRMFIIKLKNAVSLLFHRRYRTNDELLRKMINKELKPHGVNLKYIMEHQKIDGIDWYRYYQFTSEKSYNKWKRYCKKLLKKNGRSERDFSMVDVMYGLMHTYDREF